MKLSICGVTPVCRKLLDWRFKTHKLRMLNLYGSMAELPRPAHAFLKGAEGLRDFPAAETRLLFGEGQFSTTH